MKIKEYKDNIINLIRRQTKNRLETESLIPPDLEKLPKGVYGICNFTKICSNFNENDMRK